MVDEERQEEEQVDVQKRYLMAKIDELMDGVGPGYSQALMEELITRMEHTVAHFHEEVTELLEVLKSRAEERNKKLESLFGEVDEEKEKESKDEKPASSAEEEMSEWEKRLEGEKKEKEDEVEAGSDEAAEEEKRKKKRRFGRKKKE
ncbi:MAG: hypothetical protein V3U24_06745 [Candidatus Neomarinimicrobiota bacterium]